MAVRRAKRGRGKTKARKARRKVSAKARGRKRAARKKPTRKKAAARKKVVRKKAPRRATARKKAARKKASGRTATRTRAAATAKRKTVAAAPRKPPVETSAEPAGSGAFQPQQPTLFDAPASSDEPEAVGTVVHYYPHVNAAIVRVEGRGFRLGDTLEFQGHTTSFHQRVGHIELEHQGIEVAVPGQTVGIQVSERVREHDRVRKITH